MTSRYPRVLLITVNPLSHTSNNGKTFVSLFRGYPKKCLAQLYFHREIPTSDICDNYFKISDEDIIGYLLGKQKELGHVVAAQDREERLIPKFLNDLLKKSSFVRLARSLIWRFIDIEKKELSNWLGDFSPEIIFFCGGDANYLYKKVLKISKIYQARVLYYITDDYVLPYFSMDPFYLLNRLWTRTVFKNMCRNSAFVFTIGDKMARIYKSKYHIDSHRIMNLVKTEIQPPVKTSSKTNDIVFVYTGGLHSQRWKTLSLIGKSLERLRKQGLKARLEIYSQQVPNQRVLKAINNGDFSRFCSALDESGVIRTLREADVLVHAESFDRRSMRRTLLSISTKIPEYMSMQKCILAIGPRTLASIEYIRDNKAGYVITSPKEEEIDLAIKSIIVNPDERKAFAKRAFFIATQNHDETTCRHTFQQILTSLGDC